MSVRSFDCSPNLTRTALVAMVALSFTASLGCPNAACPTGTIPTPDGRCVEQEVADAGLDAPATADAREPDAWAPDAFLVVTDGCIPVQYWQDIDGDSHGDRDATSIRACTPPAGYSTNNLDCNDACATCHPGGVEICDALDNNCDASVDEGLLVTLFRDADTDSFGSTESMSLCPGAVGWVEVGGDCNDTNDAVSPSSTETCNGVDDNCAGGIDEGLLVTLYRDMDADSYGAGTASMLCPGTSGWVATAGDCNDAVDTIRPTATETCNGIDDNCSSGIDEGLLVPLYRDMDGDTFGAGTASMLCPGTSGWVGTPGDCNDGTTSVSPTAPETCNGIDDNCAGGIDEGFLVPLYRDMDADRYGTGAPMLLCPGTGGWTAMPGDCNDSAPLVNPGRMELCNTIDDNCAGGIDEGLLVTLYRDADGDTYGSTTSMSLCPGTGGWTATPGDCNDAVMSIRPGATEACNSLDDNCNVLIDEGTTSWGLPTTRAVSESQVEVVQNAARTEAFTITSRAGSVYAQRFSSTGVASAQVLLRSGITDEFSGAISGTTLYLATLEGSTIVGTRFSTTDLSPIGLPVTLLAAGEFAYRLRVLAGTSNVGVAYALAGNTLYYFSRSLNWSGSSAPVSLGGTDREYDAVVTGGTAALIARNTSNGPTIQRVQLSGIFDGTIWSAATGSNSVHAQIEYGLSETGQPVVGVLYHHNPGLDSIRFVLLDLGSGGALSLRGQITPATGAPFATTFDGAMDLTFSGARSFTASWLTTSGTTWQYADVRIPGTGSPSRIGAVGSVSLGTATTSMAIGGFSNTGVLAIHGRSGTARTWFRGCP